MSGSSSELSGRERGAVYAALTVQTLISAGTYLVAKQAMREIDPLTLVLCRFFVCGAVFVLVLVSLPGRRLPPRRAWGAIFRLAVLAGPLNQGLFFVGLQHSTPAHAALFYALTPVGVTIRSVARGLEPLKRRAMAGVALALCGALVLLLGPGLRAAKGPLLGDALILGAVVSWVFYTADGKAVIAEHGPIRTTAWSLLLASLIAAPLAPWLLRFEVVRAASVGSWIGIGYLGVLTSVVSYLLWYFALSKTTPSKVAVFSNLQPVATALGAWLLLGDPLRWELAVGGVLVLIGVRLTQTA